MIEREFSWLWSAIVPGLVLFFSIWCTWALYKHFAGKTGA
jgi:hypothetical protein